MTLTSAAAPALDQRSPLRLLELTHTHGRSRRIAVAADVGLDEVLLTADIVDGWTVQQVAAEFTALEPRTAEGLFLPRSPDLQDLRVDAVLLLVRGNVAGPLLTQSADWQDSVFFVAAADERRALRATAVAPTRISDVPISGTAALHPWQRWLDLGPRLEAKVPAVFRLTIGPAADGDHQLHADEDRAALSWILRRLDHDVAAAASPVGWLPFRHDVRLDTRQLSDEQIRGLLTLDAPSWRVECDRIAESFTRSDRSIPAALRARLRRLAADLDGFIRPLSPASSHRQESM